VVINPVLDNGWHSGSMGYGYALATIVAASLLAGAPSAALAQCRLCVSPTTGFEETSPRSAIQLQVETSLDFDRLVLLGAGEGEATLLPTGQRSSTGSIATLGAGAMVGSVTIRGEPGRVVTIDLPRRIELFSISGGRIAIESIENDLPGLAKLDSAGILSFRFGGRLRISGDAEGEYRGNVPIFVDYL
jgi:hypothetical protein